MEDEDSLATVTELEDRLDWELSDDDRRLASGVLADLSDEARREGSESWRGLNIPDPVRRLVLKAAARFLRNPDGYVQSRAGDETVVWTDRGENAGSASFTQAEIKALRSYARRPGLISVPIVAWGNRPTTAPDDGYVRVIGSTEKPFPFFPQDPLW